MFPYAKLDTRPSTDDRISKCFVDTELGPEALTYVLESRAEGSVHLDHVPEYNEDPDYLRDLIDYSLTLEAKQRVEESELSKREIIRRRGTSAMQLYRLVEPSNSKKRSAR